MDTTDLGWGDQPATSQVHTPATESLFPDTPGMAEHLTPGPELFVQSPTSKETDGSTEPVAAPVTTSGAVIVENITGRSGFDPAVLDLSTRRQLAGLVNIEPPTTVVIVSDQPDLGREAALVLARAWDVAAQKSDPATMSWPGPLIGDIAVCMTSHERWTREELDAQVLDKVARMPVHRHIMIIESASDMDLRASERLLKTLEEPMSPATFILVVESELSLVNTIRGRMEHLVHVTPAPRDERVAALVRAGVPQQTAQTAVSLAGRAVSLTDLIVSDTEVEALARTVFEPSSWSSAENAVGHAIGLAGQLTQLAACWEGSKFVQAPKTVTPAIRARARILVRLGLELYRANAMRSLLTEATLAGGVLTQEVDTNAKPELATFRGVEARLNAADECEKQMRTFASLNLVLAALFVAAVQTN